MYLWYQTSSKICIKTMMFSINKQQCMCSGNSLHNSSWYSRERNVRYLFYSHAGVDSMSFQKFSPFVSVRNIVFLFLQQMQTVPNFVASSDNIIPLIRFGWNLKNISRIVLWRSSKIELGQNRIEHLTFFRLLKTRLTSVLGETFDLDSFKRRLTSLLGETFDFKRFYIPNAFSLTIRTRGH